MNKTVIPYQATLSQCVTLATQLALVAFQKLRREWRARKAIRDLHGMPDRMLRDIGLMRSEIGSVVRLGGRDPTRRRRR